MIQLVRNKDLYGIGIFLTLVILIGYQELISPAIGVLILIVVIEGFFLKTIRFVFNPGLVLFVGLFLIYMLGLLWSDHPEVGWKLLEYKMSFFIFPALFLFPKKEANYPVYLSGMVWGSLLLGFRFVFEKYSHGVSLSYYEISRQELNLHPTYAAIYYSMAIVFIVWNAKKMFVRLNRIVEIVICLFFATLILATGSFAGILFLGVLISIGIGYLVFHYLKSIALIIYIILAPFLFYLALTQLKSLSYDLEVLSQVKTEIKEGKVAFLEKNREQISGTRERIMLWYISSEIIAENIFGVGTGDIDFHLQEKCEKYKLELLKKQNLNPHNQFLQIGIDLGWLGILYFSFMIFWFFRKGFYSKNIFLMIVILSLSFNALFESVLQRQSGIVFYTIVICLLLVINESGETDKKNGAKD